MGTLNASRATAIALALVLSGCRCGQDSPQSEAPRCARPDVICAAEVEEVFTYSDACDASGAVWLDNEVFTVSSETTYANRHSTFGGKPTSSPLLLSIGRDSLDIAAGVAVGDRAFFIGSHTLNKNGAWTDLNHRLIRLPGVPDNKTKRLSKVMPEDDRFVAPLKALGEEVLDIRFAHAVPDRGGLEVGGLAHFEDTLFVGFRSPLADVHDKPHAMVVPWPNWRESLKDPAMAPVYEPAILLDLDGRGIRGMEYWPGAAAHLIIAGPPGPVRKRKKGDFALYIWPADASRPPERIAYIDPEEQSRPESVVVELDTDEGDKVDIIILFDEYGRPDCNKRTGRTQRTFHGWRLSVASPFNKR